MTDDDFECPACGSGLSERQKFIAQAKDETISVGPLTCPHCQSRKCCMCDMGDDVNCMSCLEE